MAIKVTIRVGKLGNPIFQPGALRRAVTQVVSRTASAVERDAKLRIKQGAKTGRTYRRTSIKKAVGAKLAAELGQSGFRQSRLKLGAFVVGYKIHRASAPGESPADDTGFLANSIRATPARDDTNSVRSKVVVGAVYGRRLDEEMDRPYMRPAVEQARPQFGEDLNAAVAELL